MKANSFSAPAPGPVPPAPDREPTMGALVHDLAEEIPELVRSEIRLAQAELTSKGKQAGIGIGAFSAAGLLAFFGLATVITAGVLALDLALPAWAAALVVAAILFVGAGLLGLFGHKLVAESTPLKPERAAAAVQQDIATVKGVRP